MSVDIAAAVSQAKAGKSGAKKSRNRASDPRKPLDRSGGKFKSAVSADWSQHRCPKEVDFEDILHFWQTRASFLAHEAAQAESRANELASQTYEARNAAALRAKEEAKDKAAMNRVFDVDSASAEKIAQLEAMIEAMKAAQAAKALQS